MPDHSQNIAHLLQLENNWKIQTVDQHIAEVAKLAGRFAAQFGFGSWGELIGYCHDLGKFKSDFQNYIRKSSGYDTTVPDYKDKSHSMVGAVITNNIFPDATRLLANPIAGHHRGLYDICELNNLLSSTSIPSEIELNTPTIGSVKPNGSITDTDISHLCRMLFSCLVDADYLDTERFMNPQQSALRNCATPINELKHNLDNYLKKLADLPATPLNKIRTDIQKQCEKAASSAPGFFSLSVPTGGGKTISSIVWAINHAIAHKKERIIIAIPFTSIVVQTAATLRHIFGTENVIEHHSLVDEDDDNAQYRNRLACENWEAPIIVTTNVQLLESMFSNKPGKCRKLHALVNSIVIFDEIQTMPLEFLQPVVNALRTYVKLFGTSFLFCSASQLILDGNRKGAGTAIFKGIEKQAIREIIDPRMNLHNALRRVKIDFMPESITSDDIARQLTSHNRVMCIVNTRRIAKEIFDLIQDNDNTFHLSRMMCPKHIINVIDEVKARLTNDDSSPIRLISTQLIEAGVDIDFPTVYRQLCGLDSILQAAGRCNREGKIAEATTTVFQLNGFKPFPAISNPTYSMLDMLAMHPLSDWLAPETMNLYFELLYSRTNSFDNKQIMNLSVPISETAYEEIADRVRLIDDNGKTVIVNYHENSTDDKQSIVEKLIEELKYRGPTRILMRQLGMYSVNIPKPMFDQFSHDGLIEVPHEGFYFIPHASQYDNKTGLQTDNQFLEQINII